MITISVGGRFHAFNLAEYLQKRELLDKLVTSYPKFEVTKYGIDRQNVKSILIKEIFERAYRNAFNTFPYQHINMNIFDYFASKSIPMDSKVYILWSSFGLKTIGVIRKQNKNAKIFLERGSAHIAKQTLLLSEIDPTLAIHPDTIKKEMLEYEAVDYITVPSRFAYNSFIEYGIQPSKLFYNPLGVGLSDFPFHKKQVARRHLTIGYVGTMSAQKNVAALIEVTESLIEEGLNLHLRLTGPIDYDSFDYHLLKKPFIIYDSKKPQKELHSTYGKLDIFILNSIQEGFGMVLSQAMSSGCPVIATANTGGRDLIKEGINGYVIPTNDNVSLKEKIRWFYHHRDKIPKMGKAGREIIETEFTWDDYGERYVKFIKEL